MARLFFFLKKFKKIKYKNVNDNKKFETFGKKNKKTVKII